MGSRVRRRKSSGTTAEQWFQHHVSTLPRASRRTIPHPISSVSPDGKSAVTADFRRIASVRPGYGYAGLEGPRADQLAPEDSGIERVDLELGRSRLMLLPWPR